jgi:hypothetical protein
MNKQDDEYGRIVTLRGNTELSAPVCFKYKLPLKPDMTSLTGKYISNGER